MTPKWLKRWMDGATKEEAERQIAAAAHNLRECRAELAAWKKAFKERFQN